MRPDLFAARRSTLSTRLFSGLLRQFFALRNFRDADAARFAARAVPLVRGTQRTLAALVAAQHAQEVLRQTGRAVAPPRMSDLVSVDLRGVDPHDVYTRPFRSIYAELARSDNMTEAVSRGAQRLEQIVEGDMQLTHAHASREAVTQLRARYWRRTLIGDENCALCVLASTVKYSLDVLKPIHLFCDCEVVAVYNRKDDPVKNEAALVARAYAAAREATSANDGRPVDYRQVRTRITADHGELGSLLVYPNQRFTAESDALNA